MERGAKMALIQENKIVKYMERAYKREQARAEKARSVV